MRERERERERGRERERERQGGEKGEWMRKQQLDRGNGIDVQRWLLVMASTDVSANHVTQTSCGSIVRYGGNYDVPYLPR